MTSRWCTTALGFALLAMIDPCQAVDRFVSPSGGNVTPFTDWSTAATNIQAAIDVAGVGDQIWVTNGVYGTGGTVAPQGLLTNRVTVTKALTVRSVSGPEVTIIQGAQTPGTTNGTLSVRCAWLADGAVLSGFTLTNGATARSFGPNITGGGAYCNSSAAILTNCIISGNSAYANGGGVFQGTIQSCVILSNTAATGAGAYNAWLSDSAVTGNQANTGGGVYCPSNAVAILHCQMIGNAASFMGGGAFQGTLSNCNLQNNHASMNGGAAYSAILQSCIVRSNTAGLGGGGYNCVMRDSALVANSAGNGGGSYASSPTAAQLLNCTVTGNQAGSGGGPFGGSAVNSILYFNVGSQTGNNYASTTFTNCCTEPLAPGSLRNNLPVEPLLLSDGFHLQSGSPCIGAGSNAWASGVDIDGQPWANPPSVGCDEWNPQLLLVSQPRVVAGSAPGQAQVVFEVAGQPAYCWWTKDGTTLEDSAHYSGTHSNIILVSQFNVADAGAYRVVASNSFGVVTSAVVTVSVACVDSASANPTAPYGTWQSAATSIQDAVDASGNGTVVLVTNGVYGSGGSLVPGDSATNRVVLDKPLTVMSINGPAQTVIEGAWDPASTNGPGSIRCVWIAEGAVLGGFTLRNGSAALDGGGAWSVGTGRQDSVVSCVLTNCVAGRNGGGAFQGRLRDCMVVGNSAVGGGGGLALGFADTSTLTANAAGTGGGAYHSHLNACKLTLNSSSQGAAVGGEAFSCLVATNTGPGLRFMFARNCRLLWNGGGGAASSFVQGSLFRGNAAWGASFCTNLNCTFVQNATGTTGGYSTNCLFLENGAGGLGNGGGVQVNCLLQPEEISNTIDSNPWWLFPNLLSDGLHLSADSPAIGRGLNTGNAGADIDGQPWANPPSIGCDEWNPQLLLVSQPRVVPGSVPGQAQVVFEVAGQPAFCWWTKDGTALEDSGHYSGAHSNIISVSQFNVADAGDYQVVASNSFGVVTSAVVTVSVACVDSASANPTAPYGTWQSAATSIQDAVDASGNGTVVLVTNGVYGSGGSLVPGDSTTNRVVLDKPLTVMSINGPEQTVIEGAWDPASTNGPGSVRCAWIAEGAVLGGFTLRNGSAALDGGGAWSAGIGLQDTTVGCVITNCSSGGYGGGAFQGRLRDCVVVGNTTVGQGGGTAMAFVDHCLVQGNSAVNGAGVFQGIARRSRILANHAAQQGGGAAGPTVLEGCAVALNDAFYDGGIYNAKVFQSTVVSNISPTLVAGVDFCFVWNSIVYFNVAPVSAQYGSTFANLGGSSYYYNVCYAPYRSQVSGITEDPQLIDLEHCAATSPCRGAGMNLGISGFSDIDAEFWNMPPTIGCDEILDSEFVGSLSVQLSVWPEVAAGGLMPVAAFISGRASKLEWDFGDGTIVTNVGFSTSHSWTNPGDYSITASVFNLDYPTGVTARATVHVLALISPTLSALDLSNGLFSLQFIGQPGLTYQLESTTNLSVPSNWQPDQSLYSTGGVISVGALAPTDPMRFYRIHVQ